MRLLASEVINIFKSKYNKGEFRVLDDGTKTIEIQNANFLCDQSWLVREPNTDYIKRELEWYLSQSLYVKDIPGKTPIIWESCADKDGKINSNYGWCIFSEDNGKQYEHCLNTLIKTPMSRQACMLYTRPSMHNDSVSNGMHDFMCTYSVQCFLNNVYDNENKVIPNKYSLKYIVYMRSNDAVFGYNNDYAWHYYVANKLCNDISTQTGWDINCDLIEWNAGSLHIYERHFRYLE